MAWLAFSDTRAAYCGPGFALEPHQCAVATLVIALDEPFEYALPYDCASTARYRTSWVALIPANQKHHVVTHGEMLFIYLDALSSDVEVLGSGCLEQRRATALAHLGEGSHIDAVYDALGLFAPSQMRPDMKKAIACLNARPQDFSSVDELAAIAQLSPSRFQHVFKTLVGMPFRRYRKWRRMALAMREVANRQSLTRAAHCAGFSSSSHFSTAFKAMFGLCPSALLDILVWDGAVV